jgi:hypothetical protein
MHSLTLKQYPINIPQNVKKTVAMAILTMDTDGFPVTYIQDYAMYKSYMFETILKLTNGPTCKSLIVKVISNG